MLIFHKFHWVVAYFFLFLWIHLNEDLKQKHLNYYSFLINHLWVTINPSRVYLFYPTQFWFYNILAYHVIVTVTNDSCFNDSFNDVQWSLNCIDEKNEPCIWPLWALSATSRASRIEDIKKYLTRHFLVNVISIFLPYGPRLDLRLRSLNKVPKIVPDSKNILTKLVFPFKN